MLLRQENRGRDRGKRPRNEEEALPNAHQTTAFPAINRLSFALVRYKHNLASSCKVQIKPRVPALIHCFQRQ